MSDKFPALVEFSYDITLDIKEEHIPFVRFALLTDTIEQEDIDFYPLPNYYNYYDRWYIYGDGVLLYVGATTETGLLPSINFWRAKYLDPSGSSRYMYWDSDRTWKILWDIHNSSIDSNHPNGLLAIKTPQCNSLESPAPLPYTTIRIKRNYGEIFETVEAMNPSEEAPSNRSFPHLEAFQATAIPSIPNINSVGIKIDTRKYNLKIWGRFYKLTEKVIKSTETYKEWNNTYIQTVYGNGDKYYKLGTSDVKDKTVDLYYAQETPSNVRLLLSFLNDKNAYEVRKY